MKRCVRWDEASLNEIEANKPVRKKITEPKTPYHPMIEEDGSPSPTRDSVDSNGYVAHAEAIRSALNEVALSQQHCRHFGGGTSSEDEADAMEEDKGSVKGRHDVSIEEHRRAHYDEFRKLKELQRKGFLLDDEDDDCSDEDRCESSSSPGDGMRQIDIDSGDDEILRTISIK